MRSSSHISVSSAQCPVSNAKYSALRVCCTESCRVLHVWVAVYAVVLLSFSSFFWFHRHLYMEVTEVTFIVEQHMHTCTFELVRMRVNCCCCCCCCGGGGGGSGTLYIVDALSTLRSRQQHAACCRLFVRKMDGSSFSDKI